MLANSTDPSRITLSTVLFCVCVGGGGVGRVRKVSASGLVGAKQAVQITSLMDFESKKKLFLRENHSYSCQ